MEFPALINIGLTKPNGYVKVDEILSTLKQWHVDVLRFKVQLGKGEGDEDTFIAHVEDWSDGKAWIVADTLSQDCIAQYDLSLCKGSVVGPRPLEYGDFDALKFKLL